LPVALRGVRHPPAIDDRHWWPRSRASRLRSRARRSSVSARRVPPDNVQ
jgi:hypothetical protein